MASTLEADEAFARRLQAQELGLLRISNNADVETPLMVLSSFFFSLLI